MHFPNLYLWTMKVALPMLIYSVGMIGWYIYCILRDQKLLTELNKGNYKYYDAHNQSPKGYTFYIFLGLLSFFIFLLLPPHSFF